MRVRVRTDFSHRHNDQLRGTMIFSLVVSLVFIDLSLACEGMDCGMGFCVQREKGGYHCVCIGGYAAEYCGKDSKFLNERPVRDVVTCGSMPCQNDGTCVPNNGASNGESPSDFGEALGEPSLDCDVEGNCTCICPPGFTGTHCSISLGTGTT